MATGVQIINALMARCSTLAVGAPPLPISYPDVAFTPPASGKYLEVTSFLNAPAWEGLTSGKLDQGLLQITVVWPKGKGLVQPLTAADAVMAHFPKALRLDDGVRVSGQPWAASPLLGDSDTRVPITIPWTA